MNSLIDDVSKRYQDKIGLVNFASASDQIGTWYQENKIEQIVVAYAATVPNASLIKTLIEQGLNIIQITKNYDQSAWPHATHGFFRFKEQIPALINELRLNS